MDLRRALRAGSRAKIALVGAGGKTTALFQLAHFYDSPVVVTTSTHMGAWQAREADRHVIVSSPDEIQQWPGPADGITLISGPEAANRRLQGLSPETLAALNDAATRLGIALIIEADGARQRFLKAPGEHEPVIPGWVENVVVVCGLEGLEKPLNEQNVHRPERFSTISGLRPGDPVTMDALVKVLASPNGGRKGIPAEAKSTVLLNQADDEGRIRSGLEIARRIIPPFGQVVVASLQNQKVWNVSEPVAGIILAAGGASRFGQPKVLLPWRGKPLVQYSVEAALKAGLSEVIVISGAADTDLRAALESFSVKFSHNPDWQAGQSASIKAGLRALPANTGAAVFLLGDQPFVTADLVQALVREHQTTMAAITAPRVQGKRGNPVLFDVDVFPELLAIEGDTGGRAIFNRYPIQFVDWDDASILRDIDTPDDYARLVAEE